MKIPVVDGNVEAALREMRRRLRFGEPPKRYAKSAHYEKPSERRRKKQKRARERERQRQVREWLGFVDEPPVPGHLRWIRWAEQTCGCASCRWLRGDLEPPAAS